MRAIKNMNINSILIVPVGQLTGRVEEEEVEVVVVSFRGAVDAPLDDFKSPVVV